MFYLLALLLSCLTIEIFGMERQVAAVAAAGAASQSELLNFDRDRAQSDEKKVGEKDDSEEERDTDDWVIDVSEIREHQEDTRKKRKLECDLHTKLKDAERRNDVTGMLKGMTRVFLYNMKKMEERQHTKLETKNKDDSKRFIKQIATLIGMGIASYIATKLT